MVFISILLLTVLLIAGSAAFFSVFGLAAIFSGSFVPVIIMAGSLEAGKLVAASFLYRYWKQLTFLMKTYLFGAIIILMFITSIGIFGFLSAAYQEDVLPLDALHAQIANIDVRKSELTGLKLELRGEVDRLDNLVNAIPETQGTNRRKMLREQRPDRIRIQASMDKLSGDIRRATAEQNEIRSSIVTEQVHTGPIIFIAEALGRDIDNAVTWMIILIIFAFDPLAVVLTVGANIAIVKYRADTGRGIKVMGVDLSETKPVISPPLEIDYDELAKRIKIPDPPEVVERIVEVEKIVEIPIHEIREVERVHHGQTRNPQRPGRVKEADELT